MKKRNLILIALIVTTLLVFTQIGAMAKVKPLAAHVCIIKTSPECARCDPPSPMGAVCWADDIYEWIDCCNYCEALVCFTSEDIRDRTDFAAPYCCQC